MGINELKSSLNEILRYLLGGVFFYLASRVFRIDFNFLPDRFLSNNGISLLFFLVIGTFFHILFRALCLPSIDEIHIRYHKGHARCTLNFVKHYINSNDSDYVVNVYRNIRDKCFEEDKKEIIRLQRSEIHLLYVASFILFALFIYKYLKMIPFFAGELSTLWVMFFTSLFFLIVGLLLDFNVCQYERNYIRIKESPIIGCMNQFFAKRQD